MHTKSEVIPWCKTMFLILYCVLCLGQCSSKADEDGVKRRRYEKEEEKNNINWLRETAERVDF